LTNNDLADFRANARELSGGKLKRSVRLHRAILTANSFQL
jgi:hypothetical protein